MASPTVAPLRFSREILTGGQVSKSGVFHYNQVQTSVKKPPKYQKQTVIVINRPCRLKRVYSAGLGPLKPAWGPGQGHLHRRGT